MKTFVNTALWSGTNKNRDVSTGPLHYGTKPGHFETSKIHFPTSEVVSEVSKRSGGHERSEQSGASERVSGTSQRANGRASDPVLQSVFLTAIDHSPVLERARPSLQNNIKEYQIHNLKNWRRKKGKNEG